MRNKLLVFSRISIHIMSLSCVFLLFTSSKNFLRLFFLRQGFPLTRRISQSKDIRDVATIIRKAKVWLRTWSRTWWQRKPWQYLTNPWQCQLLEEQEYDQVLLLWKIWVLCSRVPQGAIWGGKPHNHEESRARTDVGWEGVQPVDAQRREGYGELSHKRWGPSGEQHVVPWQRSKQPHERSSNKVQGAWWEAHWKREVWWWINCTYPRQRIHLAPMQEWRPTFTDHGIVYPKLEE